MSEEEMTVREWLEGFIGGLLLAACIGATIALAIPERPMHVEVVKK